MNETHRTERTRWLDAGGTFGNRREGTRARDGLSSTRLHGQQGYVLAMTALLLLPLMVFVSFAIDAGAWYAQASRLQRAADAAALAAVVWLPNDTAAATARDQVAAQNGFTTGVTGGRTSETTYQVTIQADAPRFFSATFDNSTFDLGRSATAEFNKPVPLGSPTNRIGNDVSSCQQNQPGPSPTCPSPQPMLWSSIQGPYETFANGDPYATKCGRNLTASESACTSGPYPGGATNELYRTTGYDFAIDVKPADVGASLTFQVYDAVSSPRRVSANATTTRTQTASTTNGSTILTRTGTTNWTDADVGRSISSGSGIQAGTKIVRRISNSQVELSLPATANSTGVTRTITYTTDCRSNLAPFNATPYTSVSWGTQQCQTGESGYAPFQVQVYENDGQDLTTTFGPTIPACHLYVKGGNQEMATYKNVWANVCTFTPTQAGVYPVRVKSSAITLPDNTVVPDYGNGYNSYSLRVTGGTNTSRLYALNDLSIWTNTPASSSRFYLAEIGSEHAGKRLQLDLYDPGDGSSGQYTMQLLAPPSGAPNAVPTSGTTIPATGIADSCRYNSSPSATRGPNVTAPSGQVANNCQVITKFSSSSSGVYNNSWLRIEVKIANNYTCSADCWWTVRYDFGTSGSLPTDRTVWSLKIVGDPVHLTD